MKKLAGAALLGMLCAPLQAADEPPAEVREWIARAASPIAGLQMGGPDADLAPIGALAQQADVLAFGEGGHDSHEMWSFRNRLFAYLVEKQGYTAIAAETAYANALATNDYVLGKDVAPDLAAAGVFSWTPGIYAENLELVNWMRAYNARPGIKRKIRFYGLEMAGCMKPDGAPLLKAISGYVDTVAPDQAQPLREMWAPLSAGFSRAGYPGLSEAERRDVTVAAQDLVSLFERYQAVWIGRSSEDAFFRTYRLAIAVRQLAANFRMAGQGRDIADAENLRWVLDREGRQGRIFLFAHNTHVAKWRQLPANLANLHSSLGQFAQNNIGERYKAIGSVYSTGIVRDILGIFHPANATYALIASPQGSMSAVLENLKFEQFYISLNTNIASSATRTWLNKPIMFRNMNTAAQMEPLIPSASFDGIVFLRSMTPVRPLVSALEFSNEFPCQAGAR